MSNRIDLTQFEQLTVGKIGWWADFSREYGQHLILSGSGDDNDLEYIAEVYSETDKNLLVQFPELIAELKRCYEKIDEIEYRLEMAEDVLGRSDWNSVYRELIAPPEWGN